MEKPTIEEVLKLISFERDKNGKLRILNVRGSVDYVSGNVEGDVYGNVEGIVHGDVRHVKGDVGSVRGDVGHVGGDVRHNVGGNVCGDVCCDVEGSVRGGVYGNISRNVEGNVGGDVFGNVGSVCSNVPTPLVEMVNKACCESGIHQYCTNIMADEQPSKYIMAFAKKLLNK